MGIHAELPIWTCFNNGQILIETATHSWPCEFGLVNLSSPEFSEYRLLFRFVLVNFTVIVTLTTSTFYHVSHVSLSIHLSVTAPKVMNENSHSQFEDHLSRVTKQIAPWCTRS